MTRTYLLCLLPLLGLFGCATSQPPADAGPSPSEVTRSGQQQTSEIHWGGQIVKVKNLRDRTLLEVLAFPLNSKGEPRTREPAQGRFIVEKSGFLEPQEYAPNRLLEVRGILNGFTDGQVGASAYRYPVVISERLKLWPREPVATGTRYPRVSPRVNVGVGSGGSRVGVGVGIGF